MSHDELSKTSAWRRPSTWLGWAEIATGVAVGFGGCYASLAANMSMAGVGMLFSLIVALMVLVVPGASLLLSRHRLRWLPQLAPIGVLTWMVVMSVVSEPR